MVNSDFVTDAELTIWVNLALAELHDILVTSYEDYYFKEVEYTIPGDGSGSDLPSDFYKVLGCDLSSGGGTYRMRPYTFQQRHAYGSNNAISIPSVVFYNVRGSKIYFIPKNSNGKVTLIYVPEAGQFTSDDQTIVDIAPQCVVGWEEFLMLHVCIKMLQKEESDPSLFMQQLAAQTQRLQLVTSVKDPGESRAIEDVTTGTYDGDFSYI